MAPTRKVQFVLKASKLCNLRCKYCYEMASLADRRAMSREQLLALYENIRDHYLARDAMDGERTEITFIWHGGEPLLRPPAWFRDTFADQRRVFGEVFPVTNVVQTNLTVLDEERLALLKDGFDVVGVSVDLFGDLREDLAGHSRQPLVLANLDRLRKAGVPFGAIVVLSKANLARLDTIYAFFRRAGVPFRLLPLFDGAYADQHAGYELTTAEVVAAFTRLYDLWSADTAGVPVDPIVEMVSTVFHHVGHRGGERRYDKRAWLPVLLVDTNGDCYTYGDPYGAPEACLGNAFTQSLGAIFAGEAFDRSCRAAEARMAANCTGCPWFGSCSGYPIADEHYNCREEGEGGVRRCAVEPAVFAHIAERLRARPEVVGLLRGEAAAPTGPA